MFHLICEIFQYFTPWLFYLMFAEDYILEGILPAFWMDIMGLKTLNNYKMRLGCRNYVASLPSLPLSSIKRLKIKKPHLTNLSSVPHLTNLSSVPTLLTLNLPVFKVLSCLSCCSENILFKYLFKNFVSKIYINGLKELILILVINFFI